MAGINVVESNRVLESLLRGTAFGTAPTTPLKLGLHTGDPGAAGTSNEVTGGTYVRQAITFVAAAGGATAMTGSVDTPGMPACTVTHASLFDTGGLFLFSAALAVPIVCAAGDTVRMTAWPLTLA